jgi:hypothetical protein
VTTDSNAEFRFDVALSFAGEDREYVGNIADQLRARGISVFYDQYEQATLWGKDLYEHLDDVYQRAARYCVLFVSEHYARKVWTTHERKSAQARALREKDEYILPVRFDDTEIPGLRPTISYIDTRTTTPDELIDLILQKLQRPLVQAALSTASIQIPHTAEQRRQLLTRRPVVWEYLLFAGILAEGKDALEPKWRDHQLHYVRKAGPVLSDTEASRFIREAMHELWVFTENLDRILRDQIKKEPAHGTPEVPSDPARIEYLGQRVVEIYEGLLDWPARIRGARTSDNFNRVFEVLASYADNPIEQTRAFIDQYVDEVSRLPGRLADPDRLADPNREPIRMAISITWELDDRLSSEFDREMDRLARQGLLE